MNVTVGDLLMYKLKIKRHKDKTRIIAKLSGGTKVNVPEFKYLCLMTDSRVAVPMSYSNNKLVYEIPFSTTLSQLLSSYITEDTFFRIIADFVSVVSLVNNSQLSINNLVLDMNYIFTNQTGQGALFLYQPLLNSETRTNVFYFLQAMVSSAVFPIGENVSRLKSFRQFLNSQQYFNETAFMEFLNPKKAKKESSTEQIVSPSAQTDYGQRCDSRYAEYESRYGAEPASNMYEIDDRTLSIDELVEEEANTSVLGETEVLGSPTSAPALERAKNGEKVRVNKPSFKIGSDRGRADYWISNNKAVSRLHAVITSVNGRYMIRDNNSTNGSFLNGSQLVPGRDYELHTGDRIILADEEFTFVIR